MDHYLLGTPLAAFVLCFFLAVFVLFRNHRSTSHRLLSVFLTSMAAGGILLYFMRDSPDTEHALRYYKALMPVFVLQGVIFLHFSIVHTRVNRGKLLLPVAYLLLLAVIVISFLHIGLLAEGMDEDRYGYFPMTGPLFFLVPLCGYLFCMGGLANYVKGYRGSLSQEVRTTYLYVIAGVCSFLLGGVFDLLSVFGAPIPPVALLGNIVFCLLVSIAILKYHLLEIHVVLRRGTAYLMMSALLVVPYVGIIVGANRIIETGDIALWIQMVVLMALAFGLLPLWGRVQRLVDRWFYRERYSHLRALAKFSQGAHDISDLDELGTSLVGLIGQALQTSGVYLLGPSASGDFNLISSAGASDVQFGIGARSPLVQWLRARDGVLRGWDLDILPQLQAVPGKEREELRRIGAQIYVPLKTKENELVGVLILGKRLSGQPYSQEDEHLVYTVASRMAVELENARLYNMERVVRRELQRQNEQKTEFLHSVAHELKTPLTAIISSSELLQMD
ncbi:MAG: GAF domain-containing protein, partial [Chloroflexi bacterium]|nr:GAF domain-containing protein [Chloroflexota bacterium]